TSSTRDWSSDVCSSDLQASQAWKARGLANWYCIFQRPSDNGDEKHSPAVCPADREENQEYPSSCGAARAALETNLRGRSCMDDRSEERRVGKEGRERSW